jgi:ATP-binding cassette subfamily B protein
MPRISPLRRLLPYYRPYRWHLIGGLACVIAASALASFAPAFLSAAIDTIRSATPSAARLRRVAQFAGAMVGVAVIAGTFRYAMRELMNGLSRRIEYDLRNDLYAHLLTLDAGYFAATRTGDLMARLTNDLSAVRQASGPAIMYLANTVFGAIFALIFMLRIDGRLTLIAVAPLALLPIIGLRLGKKIHDRFEAVQDHFGTLTTQAQENIAGVRVVRAYRQEEPETRRFEALNDEYLHRNMRLVRLYGLMNPAFALLAGLGAVAVLGAGGALAVRGVITIGAFVAFGIYLGMLTWPMIALGWVINLFQRGAASMGRLNEIFDATSALAEPPAPRHLPPAGPNGRSIAFRNVGFHYPTLPGASPRWVLRHVTFTVPAGASLAVVGATGSGKSALIDLIPRLYDPQEGEILLDGVPVQDIPIDELRREIGYAPQESLLFSDTIDANLLYGTDDVSRARWAAGVAQLESTIAGFPGGFETMLGERGINLSGGQKQRTALARALARDPSVVLLDDSLSAVDTHTEAEILRGLRSALHGRTTVLASHRIGAVRDASWIIVLDEGRVVEEGRHEALMARGGRYWSLLRRQQLEASIEEEDRGGEAGPDSPAESADDPTDERLAEPAREA